MSVTLHSRNPQFQTALFFMYYIDMLYPHVMVTNFSNLLKKLREKLNSKFKKSGIGFY